MCFSLYFFFLLSVFGTSIKLKMSNIATCTRHNWQKKLNIIWLCIFFSKKAEKKRFERTKKNILYSRYLFIIWTCVQCAKTMQGWKYKIQPSFRLHSARSLSRFIFLLSRSALSLRLPLFSSLCTLHVRQIQTIQWECIQWFNLLHKFTDISLFFVLHNFSLRADFFLVSLVVALLCFAHAYKCTHIYLLH